MFFVLIESDGDDDDGNHGGWSVDNNIHEEIDEHDDDKIKMVIH